MPDWDDLRLTLAVARAGSLAGAARALSVDHSTVFRRLGALERGLGVRLFERLPQGYQPTAAGERIIEGAERMEAEAMALDRDVSGRDTRLEGRLRVTASESTAYRLLPPLFARFRREHPGIRIELAIDNRLLSLSKREADIAIRAMRPTQDSLFGRKLGDVAWTLYAAADYIKRHGGMKSPAGLNRHAVIGWEEGATQMAVADWLARTASPELVVYRTSSLVNQMLMAKAGVGVAVLPCYLADPERSLRRLMPPLPELARELWIATHGDLRRTARVRAFFELVGEGIAAQRAVLEGRGTGLVKTPNR
ncbi:MAG TPA: LysR family transcriptional regulator [Candidatus Cybelea sp.]|nr:LysR family transcriptional regulator [Candidatus Cybelea sp.]